MTDEEEQQFEADVFDDLEIEAALHHAPVYVPRVDRTPATAERYAFLGGKKFD